MSKRKWHAKNASGSDLRDRDRYIDSNMAQQQEHRTYSGPKRDTYATGFYGACNGLAEQWERDKKRKEAPKGADLLADLCEPKKRLKKTI